MSIEKPLQYLKIGCARAYACAAEEFLAWCADVGVPSSASRARRHLDRSRDSEAGGSSVKQRLAALRHLLYWLVNGQVMPVNPAGSVHGPGTS